VLGGALVLSRQAKPGALTIDVDVVASDRPRDGTDPQRLARLASGNAMAPMLPLFEALARGQGEIVLHAGEGRAVRVRVASHAAQDLPVAAGVVHG